MTPRLQCHICLDVLLLRESAAVRCGHVFHLHCIMQWFENCNTCPVCRKKAATRDLIQHLFFQMDENKNFASNSTDPFEMQNQLHTASENLEKAQQAATKAKNEADVCLAENLLLKEKLANLKSVSRLNVQQIRHLESMVSKQLDMEKELQKCKKRLQAAAFYELLVSVKDEPVAEIDKYIANEELEVKKFIALLRRQLKDTMRTVENQKEELQKNRKKISELQKKLSEHRNINVALKKELDSARRGSSQTVMNSALEEVITSPVQHSFDRDELKVYPASLMTSACKSTSGNCSSVTKLYGTMPVQSSLPDKSAKNEPTEDIDNEMEEVFVPPIIRRFATSTLPHRIVHKTRTVNRNQMTGNRGPLKKSSYIRKKKVGCSLYHGLKNDTITID